MVCEGGTEFYKGHPDQINVHMMYGTNVILKTRLKKEIV